MNDSKQGPRICTPREYCFVLIVGLLVLGITSIPYALGAAMATEERVFGGFVYALEDCYSYLAKMRQGAEGAWLFRIAYTAEPHRRTLFFPFHLLLGKVAALLPGSDLTANMVWVYHGARLIFGMLLLVTVYRFLAAFTERVVVRRLAWMMVILGAGLGWLLVALGQDNWLDSMPLDFLLPEGFTFLVLYSFPHIALSRTLLLWGILFLMRAWGERNIRPAALAGLSWLLMGLVVPFYVAIAWAVTGAMWLALWLRERRIPWQEAMLAGIAALISSPMVLYSAWAFTSDPVYVAWGEQNRILSPNPFHYLAAYGVPLVLAAFAARDAWRGKGPAWLALAWVGVVPVLVYLPFNLQRRLVEGVQVPLSLLAAQGLVKIADTRYSTSGLRFRLVVAVVLAVMSLTNVLLVAGNCLTLQEWDPRIYRDAGEIAALDWLGGRVGFDDVVLTAHDTGNYLPARTKARAFVGHGPETVRADEKKALVARFFDAATGDAWRRDLLAQYGVDYVFWGPQERALGAFDPLDAEYLVPIYDVGGYTLFEVGERWRGAL